MANVTIKVDDTHATVTAPYDPNFPNKAKNLGGRWMSADKAWRFDIRDIEQVRQLCRDVYGTDGGSEGDEPKVTVRVHVHSGWYSEQEVRMAGRRLAWRPERDASVRLDAGVVIVAGAFPHRGGSVKNPRLCVEDDVVLEIRDVLAGAAQKMVDENEAVIVDSDDHQKNVLMTEREHLVARLAEIDAAIEKLKGE